MEARVHSFHAARDCRPLYPNLLRRGLVRLWSNPAPVPEASFTPGALDVDETYHPFRADGRVDKRMAFLGAPIDGLVHLQLSLARPGGNSSIPNLLNRWAEETFRMLMSSLETERGDVLGGGTAANELAQSAHANH